MEQNIVLGLLQNISDLNLGRNGKIHYKVLRDPLSIPRAIGSYWLHAILQTFENGAGYSQMTSCATSRLKDFIQSNYLIQWGFHRLVVVPIGSRVPHPGTTRILETSLWLLTEQTAWYINVKRFTLVHRTWVLAHFLRTTILAHPLLPAQETDVLHVAKKAVDHTRN